MVAFSEGGRSFAIQRGRGASVVPTLISSKANVVTRREISISRSNASCALQSFIRASVSGSQSSSLAVAGVAYAPAVSMTSI